MSDIYAPYNLMLNSLHNIYGYNEFSLFINKRLKTNNDWRAEIKSLYEINKVNHPLEKICSQDKSEPEGIFKIKKDLGIIEAAFIRYLFDKNFETNKTINKINNLVEPFKKKLVSEYKDYRIMLFLKKKPTDYELNNIKTCLCDFFTNKHTNLFIVDTYGLLEIFKSNYIPSRIISNIKIGFSFTHGGTVIQSYNVNLNDKIVSVIKSKRNQHKLKYKNHIKIYYFYVDCPIPRLDEIDDNLIPNKLHDDEVVTVNAVGTIKETLEEYKKIYGKNKDLFDFSNPYFKPYKPYNGESIKIPFGIF